MQKLSKYINQSGIVAPMVLLIIIAVGVLSFLVISSSLPLKNGLLSALFPKDTSQAAGIVDLEMVPSNVSVAANQTFLMDVVIDGKTDNPTVAQLAIKYDPQVLQATKFEPGFYFNKSDAFGPPNIDQANGMIYATLTQGPICPTGPTSCAFSYKTGAGTIATIEFKALKATSPTSAVQFAIANNETQIASLNKNGDQRGATLGSIVTISGTPSANKNAYFSLSPATQAVNNANEFPMQVKVRTATDSANLFNAKLSFDPTKFMVSRIDTAGSFITQWINDNSFDNTVGKVSLVGAVPTPGYKSPTAGATMATVYFKALANGTGDIRFDGASTIYRNSDNIDILLATSPTTITATNITVPGPSATPAPTTAPTSAPTAGPTTGPTTAPTPTSAPTTVPTPTAIPTPAPTTAPVACTVTDSSWVATSNPIIEGKVVTLKITTTGNCIGKTASFKVLEDDSPLGTDDVTNTPPSAKFRADGSLTSSWIAEFQDDALLGVGNPPEFFFNTTIDGVTTKSKAPQLSVTKVGTGGPVVQGDFNGDGKSDLTDLSILYTNWNRQGDVPDALELFQPADDKVNTLDATILLQILRAGKIID